MNLKEDSKNIFVYGMGLLTYFGKPRILKTGANVPHGCLRAMLRQRPEEVLEMFSEALRILDENTVKYMIEELQKKVEEKDAVINEQCNAMDRINAENEALKRQLEELGAQIELSAEKK